MQSREKSPGWGQGRGQRHTLQAAPQKRARTPLRGTGCGSRGEPLDGCPSSSATGWGRRGLGRPHPGWEFVRACLKRSGKGLELTTNYRGRGGAQRTRHTTGYCRGSRAGTSRPFRPARGRDCGTTWGRGLITMSSRGTQCGSHLQVTAATAAATWDWTKAGRLSIGNVIAGQQTLKRGTHR
jgi:hypothetical protein